MKKIVILIVLSIILLVGVSCQKEEDKVKVLLPDGIPAIAFGGAFELEECEYNVVNGANVLSSELMKENYDVIVAPIMTAVQLYLKGSINYELKTIISTGNSYIVCREENNILSLKDLEGETIAVYGQNTAPDILLRAALISNNVDIDKITFVYENSVMDVLSNRFIGKEAEKYILSTEPVITKISNKYSIKINKIDIQEALKNEIDLIPQAGIFVKKSLNESKLANLFDKLDDNVHKITVSPKVYCQDLRKYEGEYKYIFDNLSDEELLNSMANKTIVYCDAFSYKNKIDSYINLIKKYNSKLFSGEINEDFYKK